MITCTFENKRKTSLRHVVVHAIVEKDGKILLEKRASGMLEAGKWALPGGFLNRDETASEGVLRELQEETGWEGKVISLFRINTNPNRPHEDRQNVAFDFLIKPLKLVTTSDQEVTRIEWVDISKLPPLSELAFDHGESLALYLKYRNKPYHLPIFN